jgi:hypothetical protein
VTVKHVTNRDLFDNRFTVRGSTERDEESEQSKKEVLQELERQQAASTVLRHICD